MNFLSVSWLWMYAGALLMFLELLSPGFVIFFFGLSAMTVGIVRFAIGDALSLTWQLVLFSCLSILYLIVLRRRMRQLFSGEVAKSETDFNNESVGRTGRIVEAVLPPSAGRVLIGDAEWTAVADCKLEVGDEVRVVRQKNLTLTVSPING